MPKKNPRTGEQTNPRRRQPLKRQRLGDVTVSIIHDGPGFMVAVHSHDGKRTRQRCATLAEANAVFSKRTAETVRHGAAAAAAVDDGDTRAVADFKTATSEWVPRPTIAVALDFFIEQHRAIATTGTVADAIERRKSETIRRGLSASHKKDVENRLDKFAATFGKRPLAGITPQEIERWLSSLEVAPQTQENFRRIVGSIFSDAVGDGRMARNPAARVKTAKIIRGEPGTITAAQLAALMAALPSRSIPAVAVQALAALRRSETLKLDWRHVKIAEGVLTIDATVAKTSDRRHIPISLALTAWLKPHAQAAGRLAPTEQQLRKDLDAARAGAGITEWPDHALRHSSVSAWAAIEPDFAAVVKWAGHSLATSDRHYRALKSRAEADAWVATFPPDHEPT